MRVLAFGFAVGGGEIQRRSLSKVPGSERYLCEASQEEKIIKLQDKFDENCTVPDYRLTIWT